MNAATVANMKMIKRSEAELDIYFPKLLQSCFACHSVFERSAERFAGHDNASKYKVKASVPIRSEPMRLLDLQLSF
jgi:hypothetical protein